ncbi:hypothetical protein GobsT_35800 [Gemmata obscuriglobus]|nr:hypothetical protein GobsT_35800 [Gemmata obscuriglobus]VTS07156.1 unnamed protein product [Gemmata obscuriglobus UQM 2246]
MLPSCSRATSHLSDLWYDAGRARHTGAPDPNRGLYATLQMSDTLGINPSAIPWPYESEPRSEGIGRPFLTLSSPHPGAPHTRVPPGEVALREVSRLVELLTGVTLTRLQCSPRGTCLDLSVSDPQSLAWLAHDMCANDVRFLATVDWCRLSCRGTLRAEPGDIVYQAEFPGPREAGPGESPTALQILGIGLTHELRDRGTLKEQEATWLLELFHNRAER